MALAFGEAKEGSCIGDLKEGAKVDIYKSKRTFPLGGYSIIKDKQMGVWGDIWDPEPF